MLSSLEPPLKRARLASVTRLIELHPIALYCIKLQCYLVWKWKPASQVSVTHPRHKRALASFRLPLLLERPLWSPPASRNLPFCHLTLLCKNWIFCWWYNHPHPPVVERHLLAKWHNFLPTDILAKKSMTAHRKTRRQAILGKWHPNPKNWLPPPSPIPALQDGL